jgi:hypothetical protein
MRDSRRPLVRFLAPVAAAALLLVTLPGHELRAAPSAQDVNIVNTPAVTITGLAPVRVTNSVSLAAGTMVGIDPASNTVQIDASALVPVREQDTAVIFDEVLSGVSDPIDVSAARTLRIVAATGSASGCHVQPYIQYGADPSASVPLGGQLAPDSNFPATATYDMPGQTLRVNAVNCTAHVVIFGRGN